MSGQVKDNNKICGRLCVEMKGHLASPLSIGSGEQEDSNADVLLNAKNVPFIPGSALAGVLRSYSNAVKGKEETNRLFGKPRSAEPGSDDEKGSRVLFYDTNIESADISIRDGVKLNENKTASHMGKYEIQIVEQDAPVCMRIEILERTDCLPDGGEIYQIWEQDIQWVKMWARGFSKGEIRLGSKSNRGFGKVIIDELKIKKFDMTNSNEYLTWLDWDWYKPDAFAGCLNEDIFDDENSRTSEKQYEHCIEVGLKIPYTMLIRNYKNAYTVTEDLPSYEQLTIGKTDKKAVIPGSTWAGAFRSRIAAIIKELSKAGSWEESQKRLEKFFGTWTNAEERNTEFTASRVSFEETVIEGGHSLKVVRNAIDRFTGGVVNKALFEAMPWVGGSAVLRIRWKENNEENDNKIICGLLLWGISDLQSGILAVGGETAVGRGIFEPLEEQPYIIKDGQVLKEDEKDEYLRAAVQWVRGENEDESAKG